MTSLSQRIHTLLKGVNLDQRDGYRHYVTGELAREGIAEAPLFVQRAVMQTAFAYRMSEAEGGRYDAVVCEAADFLLGALESEGAITKAAAQRAEEILLPLKDAAKAYTVHMIGHAHIDMNWMWPYHETVAVTLETFRTVLKLMEEFPEFTYAQSQASTYRIVEEYEPAMLDVIRRRIKEGRWEVSASTWVEADKNMPSEESMARHLLYTKNYLSKLLGIDPDALNLDFEPDTFGHGANVPEILSQAGVKYYYYCRGHEGTGAHIWRAPSGAEVLAFQEPTWYLGDVNPNFALFVPGFCRKTGVMDAVKVYGVGDHGGGPTRQDLTYIEEMRAWPVFPRLIHSSYRAFFGALETVRDRLPVVDTELNCVFTGCYTTQSRVKATNRIGEDTLREAEALSAAANALIGSAYPAGMFETAWRKVLFSQFHDILTGSGVRDTREYAMATFSEAFAGAGTAYAAAMRSLAEAIDTSSVEEKSPAAFTRSEGAGVGFDGMRFRPPVAERCASLTRVFHLFNCEEAPRTTPTELTVWDYPGDAKAIVARTLDGRSLPVQRLTRANGVGYMGHSYVRLLVDAEIPACGWQTVVLDAADDDAFPLRYPGDPRLHAPERYVLENEHLRAEFDVIDGALISLVDKASGKELLSGPAGFFDILEDPARGMTSWVVGRYLRRERIRRDVRITRAADGELRGALEMKTSFATASTLSVVVSLDKGAKALRYQVKVDWCERGTRENGMAQLAFAAPYAYESEKTRCDNAAGFIDRAPMNMDMPVRTYACALPKESTPAMVLTSDAKYGVRSYDNTLQLTLIRAGYDPDPDPEKGLHEFSLSLGMTEDVKPESLSLFTRLLNRPAASITARPHKGTLAGSGRFLTIQAEHVRLAAVKRAEEGNGTIVRLINYGEATQAVLTPAVPPHAAHLSDIRERTLDALTIQNGAVLVPLRAHGLTTVRIED